MTSRSLRLPRPSNIETGNLTGAGTNRSPSPGSARCGPDRLGHHRSRFQYLRHDQSDVNFVRPQHFGRRGRIDRRGWRRSPRDGRGWRHDHPVSQTGAFSITGSGNADAIARARHDTIAAGGRADVVSVGASDGDVLDPFVSLLLPTMATRSAISMSLDERPSGCGSVHRCSECTV